MRKKGNVFALSDSRDRDLLRAYNELVKKQLRLYGRICKTGLMEQVVDSPASRYWVSSDRACAIIYRLEKGERIDYMKRNRVKFYISLYEDFRRYKKLHPEVQATKHIVEIVVMQPAPCFPVTPRVAGNIVERMRRRCRQEKVRRLCPR